MWGEPIQLENNPTRKVYLFYFSASLFPVSFTKQHHMGQPRAGDKRLGQHSPWSGAWGPRGCKVTATVWPHLSYAQDFNKRSPCLSTFQPTCSFLGIPEPRLKDPKAIPQHGFYGTLQGSTCLRPHFNLGKQRWRKVMRFEEAYLLNNQRSQK